MEQWAGKALDLGNPLFPDGGRRRLPSRWGGQVWFDGHEAALILIRYQNRGDGLALVTGAAHGFSGTSGGVRSLLSLRTWTPRRTWRAAPSLPRIAQRSIQSTS